MPEVRLLAVGDISLRSPVKGNPLEAIRPFLAQKDILFGNLEAALFDGGRAIEKAVTLTSPPWKAGYLAEAGFDILHLANNHIMDGGEDGARGALSLLESQGFCCLGLEIRDKAATPAIIERNGIKVGFLGYDENAACGFKSGISIKHLNPQSVIDDIKSLRTRCDVIIVSLHWGMEYVNYPSPKQIGLARSFIEAGAAVVLGHHPHVLQGIERYKSGLIAYSLGNFQFEYDIGGSMPVCSLKANQSLILDLVIGKDGYISHDITPLIIKDNYTPAAAAGAERREIIEVVRCISAPVERDLVNWAGWYALVSEAYISDSLVSWRRRIGKYGLKHFLMFFKWLVSPFTLKCIFASMAEKPGWATDAKDKSVIDQAHSDLSTSIRREKADAVHKV